MGAQAAVVDATAGEYSVHAIRFARRELSAQREHFYRSHDCADESMPIDYFVWLIAGRGNLILVDTGFTRAVAERRGNRDYLWSPVEALAELGLAVGDIGHVVLTHLHYDHTGHLADFPGARAYLQRREAEYWTGPYAARGENPHLIEQADHDLVFSRVESGRLELLDGDTVIVPGVLAHRVGGHTHGLQVVKVETARGPVVLASDASHFYANIEGDRPYSIVDHIPSMYDAFDWITDQAGGTANVVPGHDPLVLERFPAVPGFVGRVARIA